MKPLFSALCLILRSYVSFAMCYRRTQKSWNYCMEVVFTSLESFYPLLYLEAFRIRSLSSSYLYFHLLEYLEPIRIHWTLSSYLYWCPLLHYVDFIVLTIDSEMSMYFLLSNPLDRALCSFIIFTSNITNTLKIKKSSIFPKLADILWTVQKGNWLR